MRTVSIIHGHSRYPITWDQAEDAYTVLVREAGAIDTPEERYAFAYYLAKREGDEYRFQGKLGFGGKFRNNGNHDCTPYIDCYPEDMTEQRKIIINRVNAQLSELFPRS
ncbi:MAG: hypothetical protein EOP83_05935 [Verrucomicrobiaceae bacterium]|nr:MAG: hypothetical protein EOP83_05935 [Verrucomicrobiaceae bacterium]